MRRHRAMTILGSIFATAMALAVGPLFSVTGAPSDQRTYGTPHSLLEIDGFDTDAKEITVTKTPSSSGTSTDIKVVAGADGAHAYYMALEAALVGKDNTVNGRVLTTDFNYKVQSSETFLHAVVNQIAFPKFDASSKDAGDITTHLLSSASTTQAGDQSLVKPAATVQKRWLLNAFQFQIDGIDCSGTASIDPIVLTRSGSRMVAAPFNVAVNTSKAAGFSAWVGNAVAKNGSITVLSTDLKTPLFTIKLLGLKLVKTTVASTSGSDSIARTLVSLVPEHVELSGI